MKMLIPNLERCADYHVHLIAPDVANFFYLDVPWFKHDSDSKLPHTFPADIKLKTNQAYESYRQLGSGDPRLGESWKCWISLRDALVKSFLRSQHVYSNLQKAIMENQEYKSEEKLKSLPDDKQLEKIMVKFSSSEYDRAEELLEELDTLRTRPGSGEKVGIDWATENIAQGRNPKKVHLRFQCFMLNDKFGPYSNGESAFLADMNDYHLESAICPDIVNNLPKANKIIFVDNLPIDISEEELKYLYSRCGAIKSIDIFNLRPELDPGEWGSKAKAERRKQMRMSGMKRANNTDRRRSPVYAMIKFEDEGGHKCATNDTLRIFGMVIRMHPAKSYPARNLNQLHIENIPDGLYAIDVETKLSKILHPNMYVSLQVGQHINSQPRRCTINFPTFETAYHAYQELQTVDFGCDECKLNWMQTPNDSMEYWTRNIIPDP